MDKLIFLGVFFALAILLLLAAWKLDDYYFVDYDPDDVTLHFGRH